MGICFCSARGLAVAPSPSCQAGLGAWVYFMGWLEVKGGLGSWFVVVVVDLCLKPRGRRKHIAEGRASGFLQQSEVNVYRSMISTYNIQLKAPLETPCTRKAISVQLERK
jgi:hypothetical protein